MLATLILFTQLNLLLPSTKNPVAFAGSFEFVPLDTTVSVDWGDLPKRDDFLLKEGLKRGRKRFDGKAACKARIKIPLFKMNDTSQTGWMLCLFQGDWTDPVYSVRKLRNYHSTV